MRKRKKKRNRAAASPLTPAAQRQNLVRVFVQAEWEPAQKREQLTLSAEQIEAILAPWRLRHQHCTVRSPTEGFYFLRTHYTRDAAGTAEDAKLRKWLGIYDCDSGLDLRPEDEWWVVMDDAELFACDGQDESGW